MRCAVSTDFDLDAAWGLAPQVSVRQEPFGALLYHFGTRRLSFLKNRTLLEVVRRLDERPSARDALAEVPPAELPAYRTALAALASSDMIRERTP
ncbi:mycofactocin biosynthesis chaperone MftB [Amycolatopsis sp. WAC 01375]|nr:MULTISPECIES: mycofactocin biosynthesis chaperone MftB [unclassified Amycolatopsis]RSM82629.1 mycofactocin biosynthesis chaperone MftB [Amycolatopsis sp. WAC 01375]RSN34613.1 mycofactocin biosynthesis chaperone MftB [Amycolatopsis sp. WAC 01416]